MTAYNIRVYETPPDNRDAALEEYCELTLTLKHNQCFVYFRRDSHEWNAGAVRLDINHLFKVKHAPCRSSPSR